MSRTLKDTTSEGTPSVEIRVYQANSASSTERQEIASAIDNGLIDAVIQDKFPGYKIYEYECTWSRDDDCDPGAVADFANWCNSNSYTEDGIHIVAHNECSSNPGASMGGVTWNDNTYAQVNLSSGQTQYNRSTACHEVAHLLVDGQEQNTSQMINDAEHDLGTVITTTSPNGTFRYMSPFARFARSVTEGDCRDSSTSFDDNTDVYTSCTIDAMGYAYDYYS